MKKKQRGYEKLILAGFLVVLIFILFFLGFRATGFFIYTSIENVNTLNNYSELTVNLSSVSSIEEFIFDWDATNYTIYNNSLVLMMNFNNLSALGENDTHVFDVSGKGNNGTVFGAIFTTSGKYNGGFDFDGIDDYIDAGNDSSLNITEDITISAWINTNDISLSLGGVWNYTKINDASMGGELSVDDYFGSSIANIGDLDGDGVIDLAIGAEGDDEWGTNDGSVYITFMYANGSVKSYEKINETSFGVPFDDQDFLGSSIANIGDLDGDGIVDLAMGAEGDDDGGGEAGAVYITFMYANGSVENYTKINDTSLGGELVTDDYFGSSIANIGDLDGDGIVDLAIGAEKDDDGGASTGVVYILFMYANGSVENYTKINTTSMGGGVEAGDKFGSSVANIGDLNSDGVVDLAIGASYDNDGSTAVGSVWITFMYENGSVKSYEKINHTSFGGLLHQFGHFGISIANIGDLDGDGVIDLAIGAEQEGAAVDTGAVWIAFMYANGSMKSYEEINDTSFGWTLEDDDYFGSSVANIGDFNNDGVVDLAIGAEQDDDGGSSNAGAVRITFIEDGYGSIVNKNDSYRLGVNQTHIKAVVNNSFLFAPISSGWNHVVLTSNVTIKSLYVNGVLSSSGSSGLISPTIYNVTVGDKFNGTIDELKIWNISLSASEISQLYKSNLYQKNQTAWNFYTNQSSLSLGTYNYSLFVRDSLGLVQSSLGGVIIRAIICGDGNLEGEEECDDGNVINNDECSSTCVIEEEEENSPGGTSTGGIIYPLYHPSSEQLQEGFSKIFRANYKVRLEKNNQNYTFVIISVDSENKLLKINLDENNETSELKENDTKKIDLENDMFYDVQIFVKDVKINGYVELEFKEIHEEVPAEEQESQELPSTIGEEDEKRVLETWMWIAGAGLLLVIVGIVVWIILRKRKKKLIMPPQTKTQVSPTPTQTNATKPSPSQPPSTPPVSKSAIQPPSDQVNTNK